MSACRCGVPDCGPFWPLHNQQRTGCAPGCPPACCPCDNVSCGLMWADIWQYIKEGIQPQNFFLITPGAKYIGYLCGGQKWKPEYRDDINKVYAIHTWYLFFGFVLTPIFLYGLAAKDHDLDNVLKNDTALKGNGINPFDIINWCTYIHTWCFLSAFWALSVTRYPQPGNCFLEPLKAAGYFAFWMLVAIFFDIVIAYYHFALMTLLDEWYFVITALICVMDIFVMIPVVHWSIHNYQVMKDEAKGSPPLKPVSGAVSESVMPAVCIEAPLPVVAEP